MKSNVSPRLNAELLEERYAQWKTDPRSVEPTWSAFFEGFELGSTQSKRQPQPESGTQVPASREAVDLSLRHSVFSLVYSYRSIGHTQAWLDPLADYRPANPGLSLSEFGFSEDDLETEVVTEYFLHGRKMKLRRMIELLEDTYCKWIGFEYMHIQDREIRHWLRQRIEDRIESPHEPDVAEQEQVLRWLMESELFETFVGRKFIGEKRFSIEGGESALVILNTILQACPAAGVREIVMGMAHRGRLNVLANFLRKPLTTLLYEFTPNYVPDIVAGDGDVKYHLGYRSKRVLNESGDSVELYLAANPSHLEAVNSVVQGNARARQRMTGENVDRKTVLPLLLHGDAAFAGQGTVAEVLNFSQLPGYRTGGTIHLIINNQIGFTTMPADARSSNYCTDVAKMIEAPVFHVNADRPLEVLFVTQLAFEFRQRFSRDVVIDMVCYRRQGHNEADQAAFTQPHIARKIRSHPTVATLFRKEVEESGVIDGGRIKEIEEEIDDHLESGYKQMRELAQQGKLDEFSGSTAEAQPAYTHDRVETGVDLKHLRHLGRKITAIPEGFNVNSTLDKRFLPARRKATEEGGPYDWAHAEALAWATLLDDGIAVRLSGQDSRRGTFSQRHAVLYDSKTRERYIPLLNLSEKQASFCVYNSLLSEAAVLGFDYGYSLMAPEMLIMWEAQFGDFANGAQVIIDQFIATAESKWQQPNGIVMLLPHGYEGMGPEHSSARIERFLQLCAGSNMQVCNLTTPAQYFHVLRRQMMRPFRKPLIIMTPKSLLRHSGCVSFEDDFGPRSSFHEVLQDPYQFEDPGMVNRIVFCSGKVFYDLDKHRREKKINNTALIRLEQIYPFHDEMLRETAAAFPNAKKWVWCQEEPLNMGAWSFIFPRLEKINKARPRYAGRPRSASPAVGAKAMHLHEQQRLVEGAFSV